MALKTQSITGACSVRCKPVGLQFIVYGDTYSVAGSFTVTGVAKGGEEQTLSGNFVLGQGFRARGCKLCGNKYLYLCSNCGRFICYDGKSHSGVECPACHNRAAVPETKGDNIVRSATARKVEVLFVMDVSSSMDMKIRGGFTRLDETKRAAVENFIRPLAGARMGLVTFGTTVRTDLPFTEDASQMERAIMGLTSRHGTTSPLKHIKENYGDFLKPSSGTDRYIVIFTDGAWAGNTDGHISVARRMHAAGVKIITIGCADADQSFLSAIATSGDSNIKVENDNIDDALIRVVKFIGGQA